MSHETRGASADITDLTIGTPTHGRRLMSGTTSFRYPRRRERARGHLSTILRDRAPSSPALCRAPFAPACSSSRKPARSIDAVAGLPEEDLRLPEQNALASAQPGAKDGPKARVYVAGFDRRRRRLVPPRLHRTTRSCPPPDAKRSLTLSEGTGSASRGRRPPRLQRREETVPGVLNFGRSKTACREVVTNDVRW